MKVYMVEAGQYSDYRVVALYTDKEQADLHSERLNAVDNYAYSTVAEVETSETAPTYHALWMVSISPDGNMEEHIFHYVESGSRTRVEVWHSDFEWDRGWHAQSVDLELARKAALDRHAQEKAEKAGL